MSRRDRGATVGLWCCGAVLGGVAVQALLAPDQPAWGAYEITGFLMAIALLLGYGLVELVIYLESPTSRRE